MKKEFAYNKDIKYPTGDKYNEKNLINITSGLVMISSDEKMFTVEYPSIFKKYTLPRITSKKVADRWNTDWMRFWQNQLNFAVWCATTGCGVDFTNHYMDKGLIGSVFKFHMYYQIRRILKEMSVPLPTNNKWNAFDNNYDRGAYERICHEFKVDPNTDWRISYGLGKVHTTLHDDWVWEMMTTSNVYLRASDKQNKKKIIKKTYDHLDSSKMEFGPKGDGGGSNSYYLGSKKEHIDYIEQLDNEVEDLWSTFILDSSNGFTRAGIARINESIRTYCWAILTSQAQTRTVILGSGTALDAQKQFLANVEDAINSPVDLPTQITNYQNVLNNARSKVDYVYGEDLYMSPSDMELRIGNIKNYNNVIVVATDEHEVGLNIDVNNEPVPPPQSEVLEGTPTRKSLPEPKIENVTGNTEPEPKSEHEDDKNAIIFGSILLGVVGMVIYKIY